LHSGADLLEAAAEHSAPIVPVSQSEQHECERGTLSAWLATLSVAQKDAWLVRLASPATATVDDNNTAGNAGFLLGENAKKNLGAPRNAPVTIAAEARRDFLGFLEAQRKANLADADSANAGQYQDCGQGAGRTLSAGGTPALPNTPRRTAQALLQRAGEIEATRKQREAEKAARAAAERARKAAEAREKHLDRQAAREHELWPAVHNHIATRLPKEYDTAVALLLDLRDLARRSGKDAQVAFVSQLCDLKDTWKSRPGLIKRIDGAFAKSGVEKQ
jgi:hypothetical protein